MGAVITNSGMHQAFAAGTVSPAPALSVGCSFLRGGMMEPRMRVAVAVQVCPAVVHIAALGIGKRRRSAHTQQVVAEAVCPGTGGQLPESE